MNKLDSDINKVGWTFDNSYSKLPESFISKTSPTTVKSPRIKILNDELVKIANLISKHLERNYDYNGMDK